MPTEADQSQPLRPSDFPLGSPVPIAKRVPPLRGIPIRDGIGVPTPPVQPSYGVPAFTAGWSSLENQLDAARNRLRSGFETKVTTYAPLGKVVDMTAARLGPPTVIAAELQLWGMMLRDIITVRHLPRVKPVCLVKGRSQAQGASPAPTAILPPGKYSVEFWWEMAGGEGPSSQHWQFEVNIKTDISTMMKSMGFGTQGMGWIKKGMGKADRRGTQVDIHLSVPHQLGDVPNDLSDIDAVADWLFPDIDGLGGLHMTVEVKLKTDPPEFNNASYFIGDIPSSSFHDKRYKFAKGFDQKENEKFYKKSKEAFDRWYGGRKAEIRIAYRKPPA